MSFMSVGTPRNGPWGSGPAAAARARSRAGCTTQPRSESIRDTRAMAASTSSAGEIAPSCTSRAWAVASRRARSSTWVRFLAWSGGLFDGGWMRAAEGSAIPLSPEDVRSPPGAGAHLLCDRARALGAPGAGHPVLDLGAPAPRLQCGAGAALRPGPADACAPTFSRAAEPADAADGASEGHPAPSLGAHARRLVVASGAAPPRARPAPRGPRARGRTPIMRGRWCLGLVLGAAIAARAAAGGGDAGEEMATAIRGLVEAAE